MYEILDCWTRSEVALLFSTPPVYPFSDDYESLESIEFNTDPNLISSVESNSPQENFVRTDYVKRSSPYCDMNTHLAPGWNAGQFLQVQAVVFTSSFFFLL
jgi:hypothetical protein